jgi:DNA-binding PadR family transcriptional regulator
VALLLKGEKKIWFLSEIMDATGLPSGTVVPALARLATDEYIVVADHDFETWQNPRTQKAEPRRTYTLTNKGREWGTGFLLDRAIEVVKPKRKIRTYRPVTALQ